MQSLANKTQSDYFYANGSAGLYIAGVGPLPLWTPAQLTTSLWLDAADSSTITEASGAISAWNDKSGNARHATQATGALKPAYQSNIQNGLPAVYESGTTWLAQSAAFTIRTLIVALKWEDTTGGYRTIVSGALSGGDATWAGNTAGSTLFGGFTSPEVLNGTGHINGTSTAVSSWLRYTTSTIHAMNTQTTAQNVRVWGGDRMTEFTDRGFRGWYYEIITTGAVLSTTDRQLIEGYLAWKWGMVASLPADHPYKNAAPTL